MAINSYVVFESKSNIILVSEVTENFVNGDIFVNHICHFYTKDGIDIGFAKVREDDQHKAIKADYNGRELLEKFQYLK